MEKVEADKMEDETTTSPPSQKTSGRTKDSRNKWRRGRKIPPNLSPFGVKLMESGVRYYISQLRQNPQLAVRAVARKGGGETLS